MKLIRVTEKKSGTTWIDDADYDNVYVYDDDVIVEQNPTTTAKEVGEMLDRDAESRHQMFGVHSAVAAIIAEEGGEPLALKVLLVIAERVGLHDWA